MQCYGWKRSDGMMRPVDKGAAPAAYTNYQDARDDLVKRLGRYCSYCERRLPTGLAVEHKAPKSIHPDRSMDWDNFLLGCANCNSVKDAKDLEEGETLWPDEHNTVLAVDYECGGFVDVSPALGGDLAKRARALIDLVGLDRHEAGGFPAPARGDKRWRQREEAWATAALSLAKYEKQHQVEAALELVVEVAVSLGFFSVWLSVFDDFPDVKRALIERFPGTATACFDLQGRPVPRDVALGV